MQAYTVTKPVGNTDREFQAYIDLLEEIGIDITSVPRTREEGTDNHWLYVWKDRTQAERFARELGDRLRDPSFFVKEIKVPTEERGPLAPLTILSIPTREGTVFRLTARSQGRLMQHFPNATLSGDVALPRDVLYPTGVREDFQRQHGPVWDHVIAILTGLTEDAIARLGGIRILGEDGRVIHERLPADIPH